MEINKINKIKNNKNGKATMETMEREKIQTKKNVNQQWKQLTGIQQETMKM